jgi:5-methyltetrahydrofolate--homocysteine methyltransferase
LPFIEAQKEHQAKKSAGKIVLATVKGDVHDIGKNIVGVVLACNNFEVIDLGVMVPTEDIIACAIRENADLIGLSGLITPSLDEMCAVAEEMKKQGLTIPLLIGGATTSRTHTAVKIAPLYEPGVLHALDAAKAVEVAKNLMDNGKKATFLRAIKEEYDAVRNTYLGIERKLLPIDEAKSLAPQMDWANIPIQTPKFLGVKHFNNVSLKTIRPYIDWTYFFLAWDMKKIYPNILEDATYGEEAKKLFQDANLLLDQLEQSDELIANGAIGLFPAHSEGDDIVLYDGDDRQKELCRFPMLRQQEIKPAGQQLALSDYIAPRSSNIMDYIGGFMVTCGIGADELSSQFEKSGDEYKKLLVKILADRLAEAFTEYLHQEVRRTYWGYAKEESMDLSSMLKEKYQGIRPAFGYPCLRDHQEKETLFDLLDKDRSLGITLTNSYMMMPAASVCGLFFDKPFAKYFDVNRIGTDQLEDYAKRKGQPIEDVRKLLSNII